MKRKKKFFSRSKLRFYSTENTNISVNSIEEIRISEFHFEDKIINPVFDFEKLSESEQYDFFVNQLKLSKMRV